MKFREREYLPDGHITECKTDFPSGSPITKKINPTVMAEQKQT